MIVKVQEHKKQIPWNKSNQGNERPLQQKLQNSEEGNLKKTLEDRKIFHVHGLAKLVL
jgi:hypothetical protein